MGYSLISERGKRDWHEATAKLVAEYIVTAEADLTDITAKCAPGSIAHTAGYALMWELADDGTTWTAVS